MDSPDWTAFARSLRNFFISKGVVYQELDDIVQDTFCKYFIIYKGKKVEKIEGALIGIAKYIFKEYCTKQRKFSRFIPIGVRFEEDNFSCLIYSDSSEIENTHFDKINLINKCINFEPSVRNKDIIEGFLFKGLSQKEIASRHNISTTAVEMVISRFKKKIRKCKINL